MYRGWWARQYQAASWNARIWLVTAVLMVVGVLVVMVIGTYSPDPVWRLKPGQNGRVAATKLRYDRVGSQVRLYVDSYAAINEDPDPRIPAVLIRHTVSGHWTLLCPERHVLATYVQPLIDPGYNSFLGLSGGEDCVEGTLP